MLFFNESQSYFTTLSLVAYLSLRMRSMSSSQSPAIMRLFHVTIMGSIACVLISMGSAFVFFGKDRCFLLSYGKDDQSTGLCGKHCHIDRCFEDEITMFL
jgi:hypothetical protein